MPCSPVRGHLKDQPRCGTIICSRAVWRFDTILVSASQTPLSLTAATWLNLISSQVCINSRWFWYFYGLTLCSAGVSVKDITPTNLQLLKTITRQSLSILMTSVSQWTSNKPMSHWKAVYHVRPLLWSLTISIICIFGFMSYCRNRDLPFVIFPQLPWTF